MDHGFVFQTANAIGPESLDTGYILHNAADIFRTNIVLLFAILRYLPERKPQSGDQKQVGNQEDQPGWKVDRHHKNDQHQRQGKALCNVPDFMGQNFFIVIYITGNGVDIIACLPPRKPGERDTLEMVAHKQAYIFTDFCAADLCFGIAIAVDQNTEQKDKCNNTCQDQYTVHIKLTVP